MKKLVLFLLSVGAVAALSMTCYSESLKPGTEAPGFQLRGSDGKSYSLKDFLGKKAVVIAWFPKAFTTGCTAECKSLKQASKVLDRYDVALFAASTNTPELNKKFAQKLQLPYPILSDPTRKTAEAYGVLKGLPVAMRHTIYISKEGKVALVDTKVKPATAGEDIARNLEKLGVTKK